MRPINRFNPNTLPEPRPPGWHTQHNFSPNPSRALGSVVEVTTILAQASVKCAGRAGKNRAPGPGRYRSFSWRLTVDLSPAVSVTVTVTV